MRKAMQASVYTSAHGQKYAIVEREQDCIVLRKLPDAEFNGYYRHRRHEVHVDKDLAYWLRLSLAPNFHEAQAFLKKIGVDCGAKVMSMRWEGEGWLLRLMGDRRHLHI